ncbi:MAG: 50S ribosomal protein L24 [Anaerosomatales bacterium]|nr:50S ribosomal protein L24 [Coriobacteriia bacterium]
MSKSLMIRKGDRVKVIAGKDKGKESRVLRVYPHRERLVVEHVNMIKKHQRATQKQPKGGILEIEGTIHVSNVMLLCPSCAQPTRVGRKREDGARVRVCKQCGKDID